jgi:hypothetical protein
MSKRVGRCPAQASEVICLQFGVVADMKRAIRFVLLLIPFLPIPAVAQEGIFYGLLRSRDLTPFGFVRLDMRPPHAVSLDAGSWAVETEVASQNTWAMSREVERYLMAREEQGRHKHAVSAGLTSNSRSHSHHPNRPEGNKR